MTDSFTPNIAESNEKVEQVLMSRKFFFPSCHVSAMIDIYNRKVFFLYEKPFALTFLLATFLFSSCHFIYILQLVVRGLGCSPSEATNCLSIEEKFGQLHRYIFFLHMAIYKTSHST